MRSEEGVTSVPLREYCKDALEEGNWAKQREKQRETRQYLKQEAAVTDFLCPAMSSRAQPHTPASLWRRLQHAHT